MAVIDLSKGVSKAWNVSTGGSPVPPLDSEVNGSGVRPTPEKTNQAFSNGSRRDGGRFFVCFLCFLCVVLCCVMFFVCCVGFCVLFCVLLFDNVWVICCCTNCCNYFSRSRKLCVCHYLSFTFNLYTLIFKKNIKFIFLKIKIGKLFANYKHTTGEI